MPLLDFQYIPGTIKNPQHTELSEAAFTDTDKVHFPDGRLTAIPSFEAATFNTEFSTLKGTSRGQWAAKINGTNAGTYYFFGTHSYLFVVLGGLLYNITPLKTTAEATLGTDPLDAVISDETLTVNYTAHGQAVGDRIKLSGATDFAGLTAATDINIEHIVATVPDANSFTVEMPSAATSTASGGGASIEIFVQITAGNETQSLGAGYGYNLYGNGIYGAPIFSTAAQAYPRIWSFGNFGNDIVMCPGDYFAGDGQKIYIWDGDTTVAPTVLTNAPTDTNFVLVVNNSVVALRRDSSGETFIDISELGDATVWSGLTFTRFAVQQAWTLISGFRQDEKAAVVFAPEPLLLRFVGGSWELSDLGQEYPIAAPMACCPLGDGLIWYGQEGNYFYFDGGPVRTLINEQCGEFVRAELNEGAIWTSFMMQDQKHQQAWLYYPQEGSDNPDKYVIYNPRRDGSYTLGSQARTSGQRPTTIDSAFYMMDQNDPFRHFTNSVADFSWSAESAFAYFGDGDRRAVLHKLIPDMYLTGTVTINILAKEYPLDTEYDYGNYTIETSNQHETVTAAGRLIKFRFSGDDDFTLGSLKMDTRLQGRRF